MKAENVSPITTGISTKYGMNSQYFGAEDLKAARDQGFTNLQIKDYLDTNPSLLREQNVKGGGGLYDELQNHSAPTHRATKHQHQQQQTNLTNSASFTNSRI
jgi:hypothetical protein